MAIPIEGKALSFNEMMEEVKEKARAAKKEFEDNGGMCLLCGKNPGDKRPQAINPFHCESCNDETQKLLDQLPGIKRFNIPV